MLSRIMNYTCRGRPCFNISLQEKGKSFLTDGVRAVITKQGLEASPTVGSTQKCRKNFRSIFSRSPPQNGFNFLKHRFMFQFQLTLKQL